MHRHRVVDAGADLRLAQMLAQEVAPGGADDILVIDMSALGMAPRQCERQAGKPLVVAGGDALPAPVVLAQMRQPGAKDRRLQQGRAGC